MINNFYIMKNNLPIDCDKFICFSFRNLSKLLVASLFFGGFVFIEVLVSRRKNDERSND